MIVDDMLRLHVLDRRMPIETELRAVEARISRIARTAPSARPAG
jgi:hypothetical protein